EYVEKGIAYQAFVKQNELIHYIDNAYFSVVLYRSSTPNNLFCEPNRLYQLICRDIPVLVGNNPTMKAVIEKSKMGVVLDDDGSNTQSMSDGLERLYANINKIKKSSHFLNKIKVFSWDNQMLNVIEKIIRL